MKNLNRGYLFALRHNLRRWRLDTQKILTRERVMPTGVTHIFFFYSGIILIIVLGVYSGLFCILKMMYLFSLCVVSLLSSRINISALVWFYNLLKYMIVHFLFHWALYSFVDLHGSCGCFTYQGAFKMDRIVLDWERWRISFLELEAVTLNWIP
jgi:hypothetical protein